jgi:pyruvate ferredoxin oxidoreductase gamma subunit
MGAPITAYNRISDERSPLHANIYEPDYVVVVDSTLLSAVAVTSGLKKEGAIIINTARPPEEVIPLLEGYEGRVYTIDASTIAGEELNNRSLSNTSMLGAVVKVSGVIPEDEFFKDMENSLRDKFASKPHVIEGNMKALSRGMKEVKGV